MHDEPLPQCQVNWKAVDEHHKESGAVRATVEKSAHAILTLEQARVETMTDIKAIKTDISEINNKIESLNSSVKIWVLSGIFGTVMAFAIPTMVLFYNAGKMSNQLEMNTAKWERIEAGK